MMATMASKKGKMVCIEEIKVISNSMVSAPQFIKNTIQSCLLHHDFDAIIYLNCSVPHDRLFDNEHQNSLKIKSKY
jgi:hypothetical protein